MTLDNTIKVDTSSRLITSVSPLPPYMNLRSVIYIIIREVRVSILDKEGYKNEDNIIINISLDLELKFDSLDNNKFDLILSNNNIIDNFINID